jgi:hypothetical protein
MPNGEQEKQAAARAKRDQQFKDIQTSLDRASDLIEESRREVLRSQELARAADDLNDGIKADRRADNGK